MKMPRKALFRGPCYAAGQSAGTSIVPKKQLKSSRRFKRHLKFCQIQHVVKSLMGLRRGFATFALFFVDCFTLITLGQS